jgi:hypothetical protein
MIRTLGTTGHLAASSSAVLRQTASVAKGNKIVFVIWSRVATELLMVDFEVGHPSAELTTPAVAP